MAIIECVIYIYFWRYMGEILWNISPENKESVLDESRQDLLYLKKEVENEDNVEFSQKIPPKLKDIYKKLLKINSKKDIKNIQLNGGELEIFFNLFLQYSTTKLWREVIENFENIFNAQGNVSLYLENFGGLKLLVYSIGEKEIFAINYTVSDQSYWPRMCDNTPIVVDRSRDRCFVRDIEGNKIEWRYAIMPDGNLLLIDENGNYPQQTYYFRDLSFKKWSDQKFILNKTASAEVMLQSLYEKKKQKIWWMLEIKSLEDMWYSLDRDDRGRCVRIKKNNIKSKYSESILSYQTDKDFLKWIDDARKTVDGGVEEIEKQEAKFEDFYNKYFNDNGTYIENMRYEIVRESGTEFYIIDKQNRNKKLTNTSVSIFDERGRLLEGRDIEAMIEKYEAEQIYLKFIAKNNSKDAVNLKWEHMDNSYYIWYPFIYKSHIITLERTPFTDWKYAILVKEKGTETFVWKVALDNFMSASDIEKEIDNLIRQKN